MRQPASYTRTDGQAENILQLRAHSYHGRGVKTVKSITRAGGVARIFFLGEQNSGVLGNGEPAKMTTTSRQ